MMVEFAARIAVALTMVGVAFLFRPLALEDCGKVAALLAAQATFILQLDRKRLRGERSSVFFACVDALLLAAFFGLTGRLDTFGWLVLAPVALAASQHGAAPSAMAPLAAGGLLAAHAMWGNTLLPSNQLWAQSIAVLAVGLLLNCRRIIVTVAQPVLPESIEPLAKPEPTDTLELRESYRRLKEMYRELEGRSINDHMAVQLMQTRIPTGEKFAKQLAIQLRDIIAVDGLALYQVAQFDQRFVVTATSGDYPTELRDSSVTFDLAQSLNKVQANASQALRAFLSADLRPTIENCVIRHEGRVLAMVVLTHRDPAKLDEAADIVEHLESWIANLLLHEQSRQRLEHRAKSAEMLYQLVSHLTGAKTATHMAARCLKSLADLIDVDHMGFSWVDGDDSVPAAHAGTHLKLLDIVNFATGSGLSGWLRLGSPGVWMPDVHEDSRVPSAEATKRRVGSFAIIPIQFGDRPFGYFTMATHRSGGIDSDQWALAMTICQELSQAIARLEGEDEWETGLATHAEFQESVNATRKGFVVYLQPVRKEQLIETHGPAEFEKAIRELAQKIRQQLPVNSLLTRRNEGDFVVLLRSVTADFAEQWSNRVAASSALIGIGPLSSVKRMPLPIRAKVSAISRPESAVVVSQAAKPTRAKRNKAAA